MEPGDQVPRPTYFRSADVPTGTLDIHTDSSYAFAISTIVRHIVFAIAPSGVSENSQFLRYTSWCPGQCYSIYDGRDGQGKWSKCLSLFNLSSGKAAR